MRRDIRTSDRRGYALPAAVFALVIVGILVTGGFYLARQESRIGSASENGTRAFYTAEQGIAEVVESWDQATYRTLALWTPTTLTGTTEDGRWSVDLTRMNPRLFFLDATGEAPLGAVEAGNDLAAQHVASRRVGMVVRVLTANIQPRAALTTRGQTSVRGSAEVHGGDVNPGAWAGFCEPTGAPLPGILTDDADLVDTDGGGTITGDPPVEEDPSISDETFTVFGDLTYQDLVDLADKTYPGGNFNGISPQFTPGGDCNYGHAQNWGDPLNPSSTCGNYFPIIHITGDARVQSGGSVEGQGILLVDGNTDLRGSFLWHGIVIVQGSFETQGSGNRVNGGVLASNADLDRQALVGGSVVQYSSCSVTRAVLNNSALTQARPLSQRSWVDLSSVMP